MHKAHEVVTVHCARHKADKEVVTVPCTRQTGRWQTEVGKRRLAPIKGVIPALLLQRKREREVRKGRKNYETGSSIVESTMGKALEQKLILTQQYSNSTAPAVLRLHS